MIVSSIWSPFFHHHHLGPNIFVGSLFPGYLGLSKNPSSVDLATQQANNSLQKTSGFNALKDHPLFQGILRRIFAPGNYGKNGRVIHFFKKTLKEKNPPKKKTVGPEKKTWVLMQKMRNDLFGGTATFLKPKTNMWKNQSSKVGVQIFPNRNPWISRFHRFVFCCRDFNDSVWVFLLDLDSIHFCSTACWAKVSKDILSSLEQQPSFQFGKCVFYCEYDYWWLQKK